MIDCVLHTSDFEMLLSHLKANRPDLLSKEEPREVVSLARTPSKKLGDERMVYARMEGEDELMMWSGFPTITILGKSEYTGRGTADRVYSQVFAQEDSSAIYSRIHPSEPYQVWVDGEEFTVTPPLWFGVIAGA